MVCVDSGYELHVGGNGGIKVRVTDLLCKVETEDEVLEYCGAFIQLYREEGALPGAHRALGGARRPQPYQTPCRRGRREAVPNCADRFTFCQQFVQIDPWKERAHGKEAQEYQPIRIAAGNSEKWSERGPMTMQQPISLNSTPPTSEGIDHVRLDGNREVRGHPPTGRARDHRRRGGTTSPCSAPLNDEIFALRDQVPAQGRSAVARHRARKEGRLSPARLEDPARHGHRRRPRRGLRGELSRARHRWHGSAVAHAARRLSRCLAADRSAACCSEEQQEPIKIVDKGVVEWRYTTCGYCSTGCSIEVGLNAEGEAVSSRGVADADANRGKLCIKGILEHELSFAGPPAGATCR